MVTIKHWIPSLKDASGLLALSAPVRVYDYVGSHGHPVDLFLVGPNEDIVRMVAEYRDVRFKFECLFVTVEQGTPLTPHPVHLANISDWTSIRCAIAFEFRRPAWPGELPPHYVQVTGDYGTRQIVPDNVQALGVYIHGFLFWNDLNDLPVAAIVASRDVPGTLEFIGNQDRLSAICANLEIVSLPNLDRWRAEMEAWLRFRWQFSGQQQQQ